MCFWLSNIVSHRFANWNYNTLHASHELQGVFCLFCFFEVFFPSLISLVKQTKKSQKIFISHTMQRKLNGYLTISKTVGTKVGLSFRLSVVDSKIVTTSSSNSIFCSGLHLWKRKLNTVENSRFFLVKMKKSEKNRNLENKESIFLKLQHWDDSKKHTIHKISLRF